MHDLERTSPMVRVLVLMATYNGEPWIEEQVHSILAQQDVEVSLQISDDASKDKTADKIRAVFGSDQRVHLQVNEQPSGTAGANFRGLFRNANAAGFDYVALADQDDIWHGEKIFRAIENLKATGSVGYSCAVNAFWENGKTRVIKQNPIPRHADFLFEGAGQGCTFVVTAEHFEKVQEYCRKYPDIANSLHYHDWLVYLVARAQEKSWSFDDKPTIDYRQHPSNEIGSRGGISAASKRIALIKSGWYKSQIKAASKVYISLNTDNIDANKIAKIWIHDAPNTTRFKKAYLVLKNSRRKTSDRIILTISSALGWI